MEAQAVVPVDDASRDGRVVATVRPGFRVGGREIRPALVQVGRKA
jgi:molecular chaperone GrpE (heat shock protein)